MTVKVSLCRQAGCKTFTGRWREKQDEEVFQRLARMATKGKTPTSHLHLLNCVITKVVQFKCTLFFILI